MPHDRGSNLRDPRRDNLVPWTSVKAAPAAPFTRDLPKPELRRVLATTMGGPAGFIDGVGDYVVFDERPFVAHHYSHRDSKAIERRKWSGYVRETMDNPDEVNLVGRPSAEKKGRHRKDGRVRVQKRYLKKFRLPNGQIQTLFVVAGWRDTHWQPVTWYPIEMGKEENYRGGGVLKEAKAGK